MTALEIVLCLLAVLVLVGLLILAGWAMGTVLAWRVGARHRSGTPVERGRRESRTRS